MYRCRLLFLTSLAHLPRLGIGPLRVKLCLKLLKNPLQNPELDLLQFGSLTSKTKFFHKFLLVSISNSNAYYLEI